MKVTKEWGLKIAVVLLAAGWLGLMATSWADADEIPPAQEVPGATGLDRSPASSNGGNAGASSADDEYNFSWMDPEKKIYVLQNRRYLKAGRVMFSGMLGAGFSNPYRQTFNFDPRVAYYFSESWGLEAFWTFTANSANATFNALSGTNATVLPVIREIRSQYGAALHWVPWYAKINVFNKVLYFDWYFSGGLGALHTGVYNSSADGVASHIVKDEVPQDNFAMFFGTGHIYHITDSLLVRIDFTSAVYNAQVFGTGGGGTWYSNLNIGAGVGLRL